MRRWTSLCGSILISLAASSASVAGIGDPIRNPISNWLSCGEVRAPGSGPSSESQPDSGDSQPVRAVEPAATAPEESTATRDASSTRKRQIDPLEFFEKLVERYRHLDAYKDTTNLTQVTQREGQEASRIETQIACEIAEGKLKVKTPASQAREALGLKLPIKKSEPIKDVQQSYDLWLAPHMALKFTDQPLKELRAGVDEGFTATEAEPVIIDNKRMVHVELRSGDGLSEDCTAKFDLYVNSESMLIERIDGAQKLPDGASYSTTLRIKPEDVQSTGSTRDATPARVPAT